MAEETERRVTRASVALSQAFERHGSQKECSLRTGIKQPRLSRIATGELFPRADEGARFAATEGIPVSWWDEQPLPEPLADSVDEDEESTDAQSPQAKGGTIPPPPDAFEFEEKTDEVSPLPPVSSPRADRVDTNPDDRGDVLPDERAEIPELGRASQRKRRESPPQGAGR